jgi:hypothetical protein
LAGSAAAPSGQRLKNECADNSFRQTSVCFNLAIDLNFADFSLIHARKRLQSAAEIQAPARSIARSEYNIITTDSVGIANATMSTATLCGKAIIGRQSDNQTGSVAEIAASADMVPICAPTPRERRTGNRPS